MAWTTPATFTVGELLTSALMNNISTDLGYIAHEFDYAQITSDVSGITATTEGTATAVITGNSVAYDGTRVRIEFQCSGATPVGDDLHWVVLRDATVLGQIGAPNNVQGAGLGFVLYDTPTAAAHIYKVSAFTGSAQTLAVKAGPGGTGNLLPAFLRVTAAKSNP